MSRSQFALTTCLTSFVLLSTVGLKISIHVQGNYLTICLGFKALVFFSAINWQLIMNWQLFSSLSELLFLCHLLLPLDYLSDKTSKISTSSSLKGDSLVMKLSVDYSTNMV